MPGYWRSSRFALLWTETEFHVVIWQTKSKNCTKVRAARAARLFFVIQSIRSLFSGVVVVIAVELSSKLPIEYITQTSLPKFFQCSRVALPAKIPNYGTVKQEQLKVKSANFFTSTRL